MCDVPPMSRWTVERDGELAAFLSACLPEMKRSTLRARLKHGAVRINDQVARRHDSPLASGDVVELTSSAGAGRAPRASEPEILFVDDDLVVIDKPSGLLTVSAGQRGDEATALTLTGPRLKGSPRLYPCHRLDRETSGVLLLPRNKRVQQAMFDGWGEVEKIYVAVVDGVIKPESGVIDAALYEHPRSLSVRVSDGADARSARTHFRVLERGAHRTLVELRLETGRKHQIRVHLLHLGHVVLGDDRYGEGKRDARRLCLHAHRLSFPHPTTGKRMSFESPVPALFRSLLRG